MKLATKMHELFVLLGVPGIKGCTPKLQRTYAGVHQRGGGAWSWRLSAYEMQLNYDRQVAAVLSSCGSIFPASEIARAR